MIDQHKTLAEKFIKKGFWLYLFSVIIAPIGYIIKIIISNELNVSEVGILYGVISLVTIISVYNDLGMTESLKHFIPKFVTEKRYDKVKSILFYAFFTQILTSLLIASFFFFSADYIAENYFNNQGAKDILKVFAFFFIGINIFQTISGFFLAIQDTFRQKITDFIRMFFTMISVLYIYFGNYSSLLNYSYTWLLGLYIGILAILFLFYKKYYKKYFLLEKILIQKKLIIETVKYAGLVIMGAGAGTLLGQMDMQMIIYLLDTTQAGYYTNYLSIIGIPFLIITPIFGLLFPVFSELYAKKEHNKIKEIKKIFTKTFLIIGISFNILFFVFSKIIAITLFGEKFIMSGIILQYSILFLVFNFLLQINFNIIAGIGQVHKRVKIMFTAIVFNFITNLIFINLIGVYGAALATGIGWILIWLLSEIYLGKKYRVNINYKITIIKNIIFMGLLGFFSYYFIVPIFEGVGRLISFILLSFIGIIWFMILGLLNYKELRGFIIEIKKLKSGK